MKKIQIQVSSYSFVFVLVFDVIFGLVFDVVFNRSGVAGAALQTHLSFFH